MTTDETFDTGGYRLEISRKPPICLWQHFWSCDPGTCNYPLSVHFLVSWASSLFLMGSDSCNSCCIKQLQLPSSMTSTTMKLTRESLISSLSSLHRYALKPLYYKRFELCVESWHVHMLFSRVWRCSELFSTSLGWRTHCRGDHQRGRRQLKRKPIRMNG